jgi:hypothetical protein
LSALTLGPIACASGGSTSRADDPPPKEGARVADAHEDPVYDTPEALLDAQFAAIVAGDADGAARAFSARAVLSGPAVGQVVTDGQVPGQAAGLFTELARQGFDPRHPHRVIGGKDQATVRWAVDRFGAVGAAWVVTTLMSRGRGWTITGQTWDVAEADEAILTRARAGTLPVPPAIADGGDVQTPAALNAWVEMLSRNPTDLIVAAPMRGDTFTLGTAGEYAQSDEAYLTTMAQTREAIAAGRMRFERMDGQVVRLTADGAAGVGVFQMAVTVASEAGPSTLPMRATVYFLNLPAGPRFVGGHFMATP